MAGIGAFPTLLRRDLNAEDCPTADLGTRHVDLPERAFLDLKTNETEADRSDYSQGMRFFAHALFVDRSATTTQLLT